MRLSGLRRLGVWPPLRSISSSPHRQSGGSSREPLSLMSYRRMQQTRAEQARLTIIVKTNMEQEELSAKVTQGLKDKTPPVAMHFHKGQWLVELHAVSQLMEILHTKAEMRMPDKPPPHILAVSRSFHLADESQQSAAPSQSTSNHVNWDEMRGLPTLGEQVKWVHSNLGVESEASARAYFFAASLVLAPLREVYPRATLVPSALRLRSNRRPRVLRLDTWPLVGLYQGPDTADRPFRHAQDQLDWEDWLRVLKHTLRALIPGFHYHDSYPGNAVHFEPLQLRLQINTDRLGASDLERVAWTYGLADKRVGPFLSAVRAWTVLVGGKENDRLPLHLGLTFLRARDFLPPLDVIRAESTRDDVVLLRDDLSFIRINLSQKEGTLAELLRAFFAFLHTHLKDGSVWSIRSGKVSRSPKTGISLEPLWGKQAPEEMELAEHLRGAVERTVAYFAAPDASLAHLLSSPEFAALPGKVAPIRSKLEDGKEEPSTSSETQKKKRKRMSHKDYLREKNTQEPASSKISEPDATTPADRELRPKTEKNKRATRDISNILSTSYPPKKNAARPTATEPTQRPTSAKQPTTAVPAPSQPPTPEPPSEPPKEAEPAATAVPMPVPDPQPSFRPLPSLDSVEDITGEAPVTPSPEGTWDQPPAAAKAAS